MKKKSAPKKSKATRVIVPGGVAEYLAACPKEAHKALKQIRAAIRSVAPRAVETMSYFEMPGYSFAGYPYNGMFAWFSFKAPYVRLHVRPKALIRYKKDIAGYLASAAVIRFPSEKTIPKTLVKNLVKASLADMKSLGGHMKAARSGKVIERYDNGNIKLTGARKAGEMHGAWKFYRREGSLMRAGSFDRGTRTGIWRTYDRDGGVVKETRFDQALKK